MEVCACLNVCVCVCVCDREREREGERERKREGVSKKGSIVCGEIKKSPLKHCKLGGQESGVKCGIW